MLSTHYSGSVGTMLRHESDSKGAHKSRMSSVDTAWPNGEKSQMLGTPDPQNE